MDFETAFSQFLESNQYDQFEGMLFCMVREAFMAGYQMAGGDLSQMPPILRVIKEKRHK